MQPVKGLLMDLITFPYDGPIMDYYRERFSSVYIVLHPFLRAKQSFGDEFGDCRIPGKREIIDNCEAVTWHEVVNNSSFENIYQLDVALRASIGGIRSQSTHAKLLSKLVEAENTLAIICPDEGSVAPHVEHDFLSQIAKIGYTDVIIHSEFGDDHQEISIKELMAKNEELTFHGVIKDPNSDFLLTSHWDSHCSFLCLSKNIEFPSLEKFRCSDTTEVYWGLFPPSKH